MTAFRNLAALVNRASGIVLDPEKRFLVESRLTPLARAQGHDDLEAMIAYLIESGDPASIEDVIDALTTNETYFFRDTGLFDLLRRVVFPYLRRAREAERGLRIWCNACSTGQEPYSIAMMLDEQVPPLAGWRIDLQATDVSKRAVAAAREGLYNRFEVQRGLPAPSLLKYFEMEGDRWRISKALRATPRFATFNLLHPYQERGEFDLILCRNALIYFDSETRRDILARLAGALRKDGFLILGSTETAIDGVERWARAEASPMLLVRPDGPHAARAESDKIRV